MLAWLFIHRSSVIA